MIRKLFIALLLACAPAFAQVQSGGVSLAPGAGFFQTYTADGTITAGHLVVLDASNEVVEVAANATSGVIGVAQSSVSSGSPVNVAYIGQQPVSVDGSCNQGYFIIISSSGGVGHCQASVPSGYEEIGVSFATIGSAGQVKALLTFSLSQSGGSSPTFVPSSVNATGLRTTPTVPASGEQSFEITGPLSKTAVPNVQLGAQLSLPEYSQPGIDQILGPTSISFGPDLQSLNVPGNLVVNGGITIGGPGTPFTGFVGTLQPSGCTAPGAGLYNLFLADEVTGLPLWSTGSGACEPFAVQTFNATFANLTVTGSCTGCSGGVSSFSGDGSLLINSASTGGVTATLANAGAHKYWGNNTGSTAAPGYYQPAFTDLSGSASCPQLPALTGSVTTSAGSCATSFGTGSRKWQGCEGRGLGDGLNAIPAGTYLQTTCYNDTGSTVTITGVKCYIDGGSSSTLNASGNTLGALLTGAVTCSTSYASGTQSTNVALTSGDYIKFTFVADGTAKQTDWVVSGTY